VNEVRRPKGSSPVLLGPGTALLTVPRSLEVSEVPF
jgi:hypothetical protein